jgi:hypothetical protein
MTDAHRAVATLDSEREMNALLTEENEALRAKLAEAEKLAEAAKDVCENTYVGQHHRPVSDRSRYGNYEARYYHRLKSALTAWEARNANP